MTTTEFLEYMNSGKQITAECGVHQTMHRLSQEAIRITMKINSRYHTPDEINALIRRQRGDGKPQLVHHFKRLAANGAGGAE